MSYTTPIANLYPWMTGTTSTWITGNQGYSPPSFPDPVLKYDPSKHKPPEFATYAPSRRARWKIHSDVGKAKNAFTWQDDILLFQWIQGQWVEVSRQEGPLPEHCEECSASLIEEGAYPRSLPLNKGQRIWDPRKPLKRIALCKGCKDRIGK